MFVRYSLTSMPFAGSLTTRFAGKHPNRTALASALGFAQAACHSLGRFCNLPAEAEVALDLYLSAHSDCKRCARLIPLPQAHDKYPYSFFPSNAFFAVFLFALLSWHRLISENSNSRYMQKKGVFVRVWRTKNSTHQGKIPQWAEFPYMIFIRFPASASYQQSNPKQQKDRLQLLKFMFW